MGLCRLSFISCGLCGRLTSAKKVVESSGGLACEALQIILVRSLCFWTQNGVGLHAEDDDLAVVPNYCREIL